MRSDPSSRSRGYTLALLSAVVLSTTAVFIRHLTQTYDLPPLVLAAWRAAFVVLTLLPILALLRPDLLYLETRHRSFILAYSFVLALFNSLWTLSVALNGASVATVLAYSSTAFAALLGWRLLGERLDAPKLFAIAVTLVGCVLVSGAWQAAAWSANLVGILTGVLSGLGYAGYSLMGRAASQRGLNPWSALLYTFIGSTFFLTLFNLLPGAPLPGAASQPADFLWLGDTWLGWGLLFALAAGPTVLGFGLYNMSLGHLPASVVQLLLTTEPVFTVTIAALLLGERLDAAQVTGGLLILGAVVWLRGSE